MDLPDIEVTQTVKMIIAGIAVIVAFFSDSASLKTKLMDFLKYLKPKSANTAVLPADMVSSSMESVDDAVRVLLRDSQSRKCAKSVALLNTWIQNRNLGLIPSDTPTTT